MKDNGTDRDVALQILNCIRRATELVTVIKKTMISEPAIIDQPIDIVAAVNTDVTFTVVTNPVSIYTWQAKGTGASDQWRDAEVGEGYDTASFTVTATTARYQYEYRCKITGLDNSVIYSDVVHIVKP